MTTQRPHIQEEKMNPKYKTEVVKTRVEKELKENVTAILDEIGLSMSEAIRIFLKQIEIRQRLPIELLIPNKATQEAIKAPVTEEVYMSLEELIRKVKTEKGHPKG